MSTQKLIEANYKCECGKVLFIGNGNKFTAINKVEIDLDQVKGDLIALCKCGKKTVISLDFIGEKV